MRDTVRSVGHAIAPGRMAGRARRYERGLRERLGRRAMAERLVDAQGDAEVLAGPCRGLRYPPAQLAEVDAPVAKLVGAYELELHPVLEAAAARAPATFVDVGCAEGYFAVGFAMRASATEVHAYDIARSARAFCRRLAHDNGVADRVRVHGRFRSSALAQMDLRDGFLLCDVEGAEAALLDDDARDALAGCDLLVEVHEFAAPGVGDELRRRFAPTHAVTDIHQQPRTPADFPALGALDEPERAAALDEMRPRQGNHWLHLAAQSSSR